MECDSTIAEPPRKIRKITAAHASSRSKPRAKSSSPTPNIVQRIKYIIELDRKQKKLQPRLLFQEIDHNLTVFDLDGEEFLAVNAPLTEIYQWSPQKIPYQHFWVKNYSERRNAIIMAGTMLASLHGLKPCGNGIWLDSAACASTESQYDKLQELRRSIWHFILSNITPLPQHIKTFLEAEMEIEAKEFKDFAIPKNKPVKNLKQQERIPDKVNFWNATSF